MSRPDRASGTTAARELVVSRLDRPAAPSTQSSGAWGIGVGVGHFGGSFAFGAKHAAPFHAWFHFGKSWPSAFHPWTYWAHPWHLPPHLWWHSPYFFHVGWPVSVRHRHRFVWTGFWHAPVWYTPRTVWLAPRTVWYAPRTVWLLPTHHVAPRQSVVNVTTFAAPAELVEPPDVCAEVVVRTTAGTEYAIQLDLPALGANSIRELELTLERDLALGRTIDVVTADGLEFRLPAEVVEEAAVLPCP